MDHNRRATRTAIGLGIVAGLIILFGFGLFVTTFINVEDLFSDHNYGRPGRWEGPYSGARFGPGGKTAVFVQAVTGVVLVGIGGLLLKVALGIGVVGNAGPITRWFRRTLVEPKGIACPSCQTQNEEDARYCRKCGAHLQ